MSRVGLVLSGGGSRGAYEAGVVRYLREQFPKRLGRHVPLDVITGTSVGAINACFLAGTMENLDVQARRICDAWRSLDLSEVFHVKWRDVWRAGRLLMGATPPDAEPGEIRRSGLFNTSGLERFVVRSIPWRQIAKNLEAGRLHALTVSATQVLTGATVVFVDQAGDQLPPAWSRDPRVHAFRTRIGPFHAMASGSIPMLFPPVQIDGHWYTDGGLRQNTPMSPALRLGADRLIVISLKHKPPPRAEVEVAPESDPYLSPLFLFGKALNALLLDHADYDLDRLRHINSIIEAGVRAYGEDFVTRMNGEMTGHAPLRYVHTMLLRPSVDIGKIAMDHARRAAPRLGGLARSTLMRLGRAESKREADLLSYLFFDGDYAAELIALGHEDARKLEGEFAAFFNAESGVRKVEKSA